MTNRYVSEGTISIENGSTEATGTGTSWSSLLDRNAFMLVEITPTNLVPIMVASRKVRATDTDIDDQPAGTFVTDTSFKMHWAWAHDTIVDATYRTLVPEGHAELNEALARLLADLAGHGLVGGGFGPPPEANAREKYIWVNFVTGLISMRIAGKWRVIGGGLIGTGTGPWVGDPEDKFALSISTGETAVDWDDLTPSTDGALRAGTLLVDASTELQHFANVEPGFVVDILFEIDSGGPFDITAAEGFEPEDGVSSLADLIRQGEGQRTRIRFTVEAEDTGTSTAVTFAPVAFAQSAMVKDGGRLYLSNVADNMAEPPDNDAGDAFWTVLPSGLDGREIEIETTETHIRWRHVGDTEWTNLIALADLKGAAGASAGIPLTFSDSTATNEDPGAGLIRFNHATPASATEVAIDDESATGAAIAALIARWGEPTSAVKGKLLVQDAELEAFVEYEVTGLTDEDGWTRLTVQAGIGSGTFEAAGAVVATFIPSGEKGDVGRSGLPYTFDDATTIEDPGTGKVRIGTLTEGVGQLAVSKLDANGANRNVELMTLIASSTFTIRNPENSAFVSFHVTADPDGSGGDFIVIEVEQLGTQGALSAGDKLDVAYSKVGNDGFLPGHRFSFATATTDEDPGAGRLRFDSATFAEIAWLYVDHLDLAGSDVQDWLANLSSDTAANNRGTLLLTAATDPESFREFVIVGDVVAETSYHKVPVAPIAAAGDFDDELTIVETFAKRGADGLDGNDPGYRFVFDDATGETEPAAGRIRFNHGTFGSITKLIVSNRLAEAGTPDIGAVIAGWGGSTNPGNKGRILIKKIGSAEVQATFRIVDAVTSHEGDWFEVPVEPVAIAGAFSADDALSLEETRAGNSAVVENAVETVNGIAAVEGDVTLGADDIGFDGGDTDLVSTNVGDAIRENADDIASVAGDLETHELREDNPHGVTKTQVGLGNVDNTSDANKPVSTAQQAALDGKAASSHTHSVSGVIAAATARVFGRKSAGDGPGEELTLSELLDFIGSAARGDLLYRGESGWLRLAKGTAGHVLTQGTDDPEWAASAGGGLQAYQNIKTDTASSSSSTPADTGLEISGIILPSAEHRLLLHADVVVGASASSAGARLNFTDGSNNILLNADAASSRVLGHGAAITGHPNIIGSGSMSYIWSPGSTGPHTVKVRWSRVYSSITMYLNRTATDTNSADYSRHVSTLTALVLPPA